MTNTRECATLIDQVTRSLAGILRPGCRILGVGQAPTQFAPGLAGVLPDCTVIALDTAGELYGSRRPDVSSLPTNLEILSCGFESANFLSGSMSAIIATCPCGAPLLSMLADCLEPGGHLLLLEAGSKRPWWTTVLPILHTRNKQLLPAELFVPVPAPDSALAIFRKRH